MARAGPWPPHGPPSPAPCSRPRSKGARGILLTIAGSSELGLFEVSEAAEIIHDVAHPDANIIFGTVVDESLDDEIQVTVIAAGFDHYEDEPDRPHGGDDLRAAEVGRSRSRSRPATAPIDLFDDDGDDLDDDFDVPSFLK